MFLYLYGNFSSYYLYAKYIYAFTKDDLLYTVGSFHEARNLFPKFKWNYCIGKLNFSEVFFECIGKFEAICRKNAACASVDES
jgi:hypothetical protein